MKSDTIFNDILAIELLNHLLTEQIKTQEIYFSIKNNVALREEKFRMYDKLQRLNSAICAMKVAGVIPTIQNSYFEENFQPGTYFKNTFEIKY